LELLDLSDCGDSLDRGSFLKIFLFLTSRPSGRSMILAFSWTCAQSNIFLLVIDSPFAFGLNPLALHHFLASLFRSSDFTLYLDVYGMLKIFKLLFVLLLKNFQGDLLFLFLLEKLVIVQFSLFRSFLLLFLHKIDNVRVVEAGRV
jgi:hypothetical protein